MKERRKASGGKRRKPGQCLFTGVAEGVCVGWSGGPSAIEKQVTQGLNACIVFNHMDVLGNLGFDREVSSPKINYLVS